jgi:hypothetical protein
MKFFEKAGQLCGIDAVGVFALLFLVGMAIFATCAYSRWERRHGHELKNLKNTQDLTFFE